jgi:hypothetical protein
MLPRYTVKKILHDFTLNVNQPNEHWARANEISLSYHWAKYPYQPEVKIKALYSNQFLYLKFDVSEDAIQSTATKINDFVYIDSCVEFFCAPDSNRTDLYYNLEMNCCGNVFMAYGPDRRLGERIFVPEKALEKVLSSRSIVGSTKKISAEDKNWKMEVKIPWSVYQTKSHTAVPTSQTIWKGNFYKCGDKLPKLHYGSWTKIELPKPDFHRPEFFGEILFE